MMFKWHDDEKSKLNVHEKDSPNVADVQVVRRGKVRRAKLFYLRERTGKRAKVKEVIR